MATSQPNTHRRRAGCWEERDDAGLLALELRHLRLELAASDAATDVQKLYAELGRRGIRFRPHVWLAEAWFSPDGVPGIAIPFFAAHPRLRRLERRQIGEAEGGCGHARRRLLRHEAGHAVDTAYGLRRRRDWRQVFGRAGEPYPRIYAARPASRDYVLHLPQWYAQSHPTEDFAETFAVWLGPKTRWRRDYAGWPALAKLEYVDRLMAEIAGRAPRNRDRATIAPLAASTRTLASYYRAKSARYGGSERRYDAWLARAFSAAPSPAAPPAGRALRALAPALNGRLAARGVHPYLAEHAQRLVARRAAELGLGLQVGASTERRVLRLLERVIDDVLRRNLEHFAR